MNQNEIIPFGKYKGQPLEVLSSDPAYVEWLMNQDWFNTRYASIKTIIINNYQQPAETPDHNKLQAMFTDESFCHSVVMYLLKIGKVSEIPGNLSDVSNIEIHGPLYEHDGIDVQFGFTYKLLGKEVICNKSSRHNWATIELKPTLSDDYPAILRQMMANKSEILLTKEYTGTGATIDQVKKIFAASNRSIILISEVI